MKTFSMGQGLVNLEEFGSHQNIDLVTEAAFDDLTRLAACVCQTPIALLCQIDSRGWYWKSQQGLAEETTEFYKAFCSQIIQQVEHSESPLLIAQDSCELGIKDAKIRFYAGVLIVSPEGLILGILGVMDRIPRLLTIEQQEALLALSRQASLQLELSKSGTRGLSKVETEVGRAQLKPNYREDLIFRLASQIRDALDLDTILNTAVTEIRNLLHVDCCHFLWYWSDVKPLSLSVTHEARNPNLPSLLGDCPPQLAPLAAEIGKLKILRIDNLAETAGLEPATKSLLRNWGITSGLLLPLKTKTGQLGAIFCSNYDRPYQWITSDVQLLSGVINQLAIAIEHAELFAKARAAILAAQTQAHYLEIALDDLKQTESRLIQTEKMSMLGQMVVGIAHEIKNPVSLITGNMSHATNYISDLLGLVERYQQEYPNPSESLQEYIEEIDLEFLMEDLPKTLSSIKLSAERIYDIVLSLQNFSRTDEKEMKPTDIHEWINNTLLILQSRLRPNGNHPGIKVIKEFGNLPLVEGYPGQLYQVFMNIMTNAIDALENELEVNNQKNRELETQLPTIWISTETLENEQVMIRIRDNGPGMTANVLMRLFDPFFTTKALGKGTGLGLSISHKIIVKKHGGMLKCNSQPGEGAEFVIQLPIASPIAKITA
jgi:two-component system NtrC family sensor kinase